MMPIFFHLESHLWIFYLLFFNGLLSVGVLRNNSQNFRKVTLHAESLIVIAFLCTILVNGILLTCIEFIGLSYSRVSSVIYVWTIIIVAIVLGQGKRSISMFQCEWDWARCIGYFLVFLILFYNGGLIEQPSDAWWHMSYANKIAEAGSHSLEYGHLNGLHERYYPPLWHMNLAMLNSISEVSIPVFWNSFTAWGGVLNLMAFFLFSYALTRDNAVSSIAVLLFVLLPGVGDSYLRVSAWPSHISYIALFFLFSISFALLDFIKDVSKPAVSVSENYIRQGMILISLILLSAACIWFSHQLELLWFALAMVFYLFGLLMLGVFRFGLVDELESSSRLVWGSVFLGLVVLGLVAGFHFYNEWESTSTSLDLRLSKIYPILFICFFCFLALLRWNPNLPEMKNLTAIISVLLLVMLLFSVDLRHFISLFDADLAYPKSRYGEMPISAPGLFGQAMSLPGWHLQLRAGLLYSGVIAIFLSPLLLFFKTNRASIFLVSNALLTFTICNSPYLFDWFRDVLNYNSVFRIAILIFHPLILAMLLKHFWSRSFLGVKSG